MAEETPLPARAGNSPDEAGTATASGSGAPDAAASGAAPTTAPPATGDAPREPDGGRAPDPAAETAAGRTPEDGPAAAPVPAGGVDRLGTEPVHPPAAVGTEPRPAAAGAQPRPAGPGTEPRPVPDDVATTPPPPAPFRGPFPAEAAPSPTGLAPAAPQSGEPGPQGGQPGGPGQQGGPGPRLDYPAGPPTGPLPRYAEPPSMGPASQAGPPPFLTPGGPPPGYPGGPPPGYRGPPRSDGPPAGPTPPGTPGAGYPGSGQPRRRTAAVAAAVLVAGVLGGGVGALADRALVGQRTVVSALAAPSLPAQDAGAAPTGSVQQVAAAVLPSVVSIEVQAGQGTDEGSGVILTSDGLILTNNHVVEAAADSGKITARFRDGRSATATIVGRDPTYDLAVIRARDVDNLRPATFGRSSDLQVGQSVVAIGSPLGLSGTVTSGIVSAVNRPVRTGAAQATSSDTVIDAIQTDAAINPGNSGGPLVNMRGEVVGINSAIASLGQDQGGQSGSIGLGFAIPSDEARPIAQQLAQTGKADHAQLGVSVQDADQGGQLLQVQADGPAGRAGLRAGDVITRIGDRQVDGADALVAAVRSHRPGEKVTVTYLRDGQTKTTSVTLGSQASPGN